MPFRSSRQIYLHTCVLNILSSCAFQQQQPDQEWHDLSKYSNSAQPSQVLTYLLTYLLNSCVRPFWTCEPHQAHTQAQVQAPLRTPSLTSPPPPFLLAHFTSLPAPAPQDCNASHFLFIIPHFLFIGPSTPSHRSSRASYQSFLHHFNTYLRHRF